MTIRSLPFRNPRSCRLMVEEKLILLTVRSLKILPNSSFALPRKGVSQKVVGAWRVNHLVG
jgi:hypothetical protein